MFILTILLRIYFSNLFIVDFSDCVTLDKIIKCGQKFMEK